MARKKLDTLTEQMYYVLLALSEKRHGYAVMQYVAALTEGRMSIGAGTLYALLSRFEDEGLIFSQGEREGRKYYLLSPEGRTVLEEEIEKLRRRVADGAQILGKEEGSCE